MSRGPYSVDTRIKRLWIKSHNATPEDIAHALGIGVIEVKRVINNIGRPRSNTRSKAVFNPLYDPVRDGAPVWSSSLSQALGEPPIGRRQMLEDRAREEAAARSVEKSVKENGSEAAQVGQG